MSAEAARIDATAAMLEHAAREAGMLISGDGRISENDCSLLLGYAPDTLAKKRKAGSAPPAYPIGLNGCRVSYRMGDVAAWIEAQRENFDAAE